MTITAKNIGRINVWPTYDAARQADTAECEYVGRLTVWRTNAEARANLTSGGSGGGEPDWVPANAVIHIDLVRAFNAQDAAWTAADGIVAVDTLLGTDAALTNWGDTGVYDLDELTPDGHVGSPMAFLGALKAAVIDEATFVVRTVTVPDNSNLKFDFNVVSASGNEYVNIYFAGTSKAVAESGSGPFYQETDAILNYSEGGGDVNCIALTITDSRLDMAANGGSAVTDVLTETDRPPSDPFVGALLHTQPSTSPTSAIQSITLYDALPSTAGLSELSEVS